MPDPAIFEGLTIIPARPVFAEVIAALHARAFPEPWDADYFARLMDVPSTVALIALAKESTPLGFIVCQCAPGDGNGNGNGDADIITLAVEPRVRRRGIAARLLRATCAALRQRGVERLILEVAVSNHPAWALYRDLGFEEIGRRRNYYQRANGGEDAIVLALPL